MLRELIFLLAETAAASSLAIVLVLLLRRPMRRVFGAGAAYALWMLVPVAMIAVLLPAPVQPVVLVPMTAKVGMAQAVATAPQHAALNWPLLLGMCWAAGALAFAALQLWQQRRFLRRLGPLRRHAHGLRVAATSTGLPAVTGVLRPRIVLPADFLQRYDVQERALVVAHERQHIARGDLPCNAVVALLRCLHWFNPLLHLAEKHYRHDQELACDARVLQRHPRARRAYAQAMLKTQLDDFALPVGCHWHTHPIKERIAMLKRPSPRRWQTGVSSALLLSLFAGAGYAAWAQQPAAGSIAPSNASTSYSLKLDMLADGEQIAFEMRGPSKLPMAFALDTKAGARWTGELSAEPYRAGMVMLRARLKRDGVDVAAPTLVARLGETASVQLQPDSNDKAASGFTLSVLTTELPPAAAVADDKPVPSPIADDDEPKRWVFKGNVRMETTAAGAQTVESDASQWFRDATQKPFAELKPPSYPKEAADARVEGRVVLLVDVAPDGSVAAATVETSQPAGVFDAAVLKAVRGWTFNPAMKDGVAVAGRVRVPVDFAMDDVQPAQAQASLNKRDYGWFTEGSGQQVTSTLRCDAALLEKDDVTGELRRSCGISRPLANKPAAPPQSGVQPSAASARGTRVLADVDVGGNVSNARLDTDRTPSELERALMATLEKSRRAPEMRDGRPVPSTIMVDTSQSQTAPPGFMAGR